MPEIWVPPSFNRETGPRFVCTVPGCGDRFYDAGAYERHVVKCATANEGQIAQAAEERHVLGRGDVELEDWVAKNKQPILEGRKKIYHRHERWLPEE